MFFWLLLMAVSIACGEEEATGDAGTENPTLVIGSGNTFATTELTVPSGSAVVVVNQDGDPHTITSESAVGAFDNSGDFDVVVGSGGKELLTLPDFPSGSTLFFYCRFHTRSMSPSDGMIVIE